MPEVDEQVSATLNYKLRVARGNVRKFLTAATEGVDLGAYQDIVPRILGAVEQIEADTGAPLDAANDKGWKALQKRVEVRARAPGAGNEWLNCICPAARADGSEGDASSGVL